jgi:hypothetical protein
MNWRNNTAARLNGAADAHCVRPERSAKGPGKGNGVIELDRTEEAALREELRALAQLATLVDTQRFDGTLIVQILATLNAVTIPLLAKIVTERVRANRHVVIKKKGLTISGLSADNAIKVLSELSKVSVGSRPR